MYTTDEVTDTAIQHYTTAFADVVCSLMNAQALDESERLATLSMITSKLLKSLYLASPLLADKVYESAKAWAASKDATDFTKSMGLIFNKGG